MTCDSKRDDPAELLLGADLTLVLPRVLKICLPRGKKALSLVSNPDFLAYKNISEFEGNVDSEALRLGSALY